MSSDEDSEQEQAESRDIEKLHAIWKSMKDSKRGDKLSDKKSLLSVKEAIHQEEQKNLEVRLNMTENQLAKARENTALLMKKLSEAEEEIDLLRQQLELEKRHSQQLAASNTREDKHNTFGADRDHHEMVEELEELKAIVDAKDREIERLNLKIRSLELDKHKMQIEFEKAVDENEVLRKQLQDAERTIHEVYLDQESKGAQLLEIDELNRTIERLLSLLKTTQ
jgi:hypothetical protein